MEREVEKGREKKRAVGGEDTKWVSIFICFQRLIPGLDTPDPCFPNQNSSHPSLTFQGLLFYCKYSSRRKITDKKKTALYSSQSQIENTEWNRKLTTNG